MIQNYSEVHESSSELMKLFWRCFAAWRSGPDASVSPPCVCVWWHQQETLAESLKDEEKNLNLKIQQKKSRTPSSPHHVVLSSSFSASSVFIISSSPLFLLPTSSFPALYLFPRLLISTSLPNFFLLAPFSSSPPLLLLHLACSLFRPLLSASLLFAHVLLTSSSPRSLGGEQVSSPVQNLGLSVVLLLVFVIFVFFTSSTAQNPCDAAGQAKIEAKCKNKKGVVAHAPQLHVAHKTDLQLNPDQG